MAESYSNIAVITGATGALGQAYVEEFSKDPNTLCLCFTRKKDGVEDSDNVKYFDVGVDAEKADKVFQEALKKYNPENSKDSVSLVNTVGPIKFEYNDEDEVLNPRAHAEARNIDPFIYEMNVVQFRNIAEALNRNLGSRAEEIKKESPDKNFPLNMKVVGFGTVSDMHPTPFWHSYTESKRILKRYVQRITKLASNSSVVINGTMVDTATIATNEAKKMRPGEKTNPNWLTPERVMKESMEVIRRLGISQDGKGNFENIQVYDPNPDFNPDIFRDPDRWMDKVKTEDRTRNLKLTPDKAVCRSQKGGRLYIDDSDEKSGTKLVLKRPDNTILALYVKDGAIKNETRKYLNEATGYKNPMSRKHLYDIAEFVPSRIGQQFVSARMLSAYSEELGKARIGYKKLQYEWHHRGKNKYPKATRIPGMGKVLELGLSRDMDVCAVEHDNVRYTLSKDREGNLAAHASKIIDGKPFKEEEVKLPNRFVHDLFTQKKLSCVPSEMRKAMLDVGRGKGDRVPPVVNSSQFAGRKPSKSERKKLDIRKVLEAGFER